VELKFQRKQVQPFVTSYSDTGTHVSYGITQSAFETSINQSINHIDYLRRIEDSKIC